MTRAHTPPDFITQRPIQHIYKREISTRLLALVAGAGTKVEGGGLGVGRLGVVHEPVGRGRGYMMVVRQINSSPHSGPHTHNAYLNTGKKNAPRGQEHQAIRDDKVEEARLLHAALLAGRHDERHHGLALFFFFWGGCRLD